VLGAALALAPAAGCGPEEAAGAAPGNGSPMTANSPEYAEVNRVLATRSADLLAIPGVAGVAIGLLEDGKTPCLKVLVETASPELAARIPRTLDGQPVVIEVSGAIRPLDGR